MKKNTLLGSALAITLSSAAIAADFHDLAGLQGTTPAPLLDSLLATSEWGAECGLIDDSTAATWNAGEYCLVSDRGTYTTSLGNFPSLHTQMGAECVSVGGSTAATEDAGGFCLVSDSDLIRSTMGSANFAVANDLPVAGLQFLQATFTDGSTVSGSRRFPPGSDAPIGVECVSVGGSTAAAAGGFCVASDLSTSTENSASFAAANDLPLAGLQFLQVTLGDDAPLDASRHAECVSVDGSTATTGNAGGFCLASDLSTSTTDFVNFAVANDLPVAGLQFLQVAFGDGAPLDGSRDAECVSVDGSTAATGSAGGSCLASDLSTLTMDFANFSLANDLPVAGLQFLQVTFGDGNPLSEPIGSPGADTPMVAECVSEGGSTASAGNDGGFCLASDSDLGASTTDFASFTVANDLPVAGLKFLQVPSGDGSPLGELSNPPGGDAPIVVTSDSVKLVMLPFRRLSLPAVAGIPGHQPRHFHMVGDLNDDSCADREDFNIIIADIRGGEPFNPVHDLNGDGMVNRADARTLVGLFTNPRGAPCE